MKKNKVKKKFLKIEEKYNILIYSNITYNIIIFFEK
jgi:hypothetical protein